MGKEIKEGPASKGGVNSPSTTERPPPPKGQGCPLKQFSAGGTIQENKPGLLFRSLTSAARAAVMAFDEDEVYIKFHEEGADQEADSNLGDYHEAQQEWAMTHLKKILAEVSELKKQVAATSEPEKEDLFDEGEEWVAPEGVDPECIDLCQAINRIPGITTVESCQGHESAPFRVFLKISPHGHRFLSILLHLIDHRNTGIGWNFSANSDACICSPTFLIKSVSKGAKACEEATKLAGEIHGFMGHHFKTWVLDYGLEDYLEGARSDKLR